MQVKYLFDNEITSDKKLESNNFETLDLTCDKTQIMVLTKNNKLKINFTNLNSFADILNYVQKRFGQGELNFEVDLKSNEEIITYCTQ